MNSIFEKNIEALKETHPVTYEILEKEIEKFRANPEASSDERALKVVEGSLGTKNLLYVRKNPPYQTMYHRPDGVSEAFKVIRETDLHHPQLVFIFGMGLGYLFNEFMKIRTKETWGVMIVEKDPEIFFHALCNIDMSEHLKSTDVWFSIGCDIEVLKTNYIRFFECFNTVNRSLKILGTPAALESENQYYADAAQSIIPSRDQATIWAGNSVEDSFHGLQNTLNNVEFLTQNPGLGILKGAFKGKTCLSVAAGPSLNEAWEILAQVQGKIPIIACDTLVKPLNDRKIKADFITALERDPIVADFFRGQTIPERTTLIGPALLLPDSWNCFEGRKISYCATPGYVMGLGLEFLGPLAPGSSAGNLNLALAEWLGFETVIMIGHNLAFAHGSNESHVKGTIDKNRETTRTEEEMRSIATGGKVPTQDGTSEVYTILEYNLFRKQIEGLIASAKSMKFINTAAKGNKIQGADYMPLDKAIQKYASVDYDIYPDFLKVCKSADEEVIRRRRAVAFNRIDEIISDLKYFDSQARELEQKIVSWEEKIKLAEVKGNRWSIDKLNQKIDETLEVKVSAVNDRMAFSGGFISVISPAHIAFERTVNTLIGKHKDNYELKKDFLLHHRQYFKIWNKWIPKILPEYEAAKKRLLEHFPELPDLVEKMKAEGEQDLDFTQPTPQPQAQHSQL